MSNTNDAGGSKNMPANFPAEDLVLKSSMQFFGDELLSYPGITAESPQNHRGITAEPLTTDPTEFICPEAKRLYEDFNFIKADQTWIHPGFESDSIKEEYPRRFRNCESVTAYI